MHERVPLSGRPPTSQGSTPTEQTLADGQKADHWVLPEEERSKGFVRPVRRAYRHVGAPGPKYPLRDLSPEELEKYRQYGYLKFEKYPENEPSGLVGRYWTAETLSRVGKGCGVVTTMPQAVAETYARDPHYYGSTFCCGCGEYLPVGREGEFVWDDTDKRVGS